MRAASGTRVPDWLKVAWLAWMVIWVPLYWSNHGPQNFLWLCDVSNFIIGLAIFLESPLLFSSQAAGVLVIQVAWTIDYFGRLVTGVHLIGGTEYMFDAASPWWLRGLSLFHVVIPPLLIWAVCALGYDPRGVRLQTGITWVVLPLTYLITDPTLNINWLREPFGIPQTWMPPFAWLITSMALCPLVLFFPTHFGLKKLDQYVRART